MCHTLAMAAGELVSAAHAQCHCAPMHVLQGKRFLPPSDLASGPAWDDVMSAPELVQSGSSAESTVLGMLGVRQLSKAELYRIYLLPKLEQLQPGNREAVMLEVRGVCGRHLAEWGPTTAVQRCCLIAHYCDLTIVC